MVRDGLDRPGIVGSLRWLNAEIANIRAAHIAVESRLCQFIIILVNSYKVSAGNSGQPLTPDTRHTSAMDKSFGLKIYVLNH